VTSPAETLAVVIYDLYNIIFIMRSYTTIVVVVRLL